MAGIKSTMPTDLMKLLGNLESNTDQICINAMKEAELVLIDALKSECAKHHISKHDKTRGEMEASIKADGPRKNKYGFYDFIAPDGIDSKGVPNGLKLNVLEYGKEGQPSTPVCTPARNRVKEEVEQIIQKSIERQAGL